jgi:hypothetical protein
MFTSFSERLCRRRAMESHFSRRPSPAIPFIVLPAIGDSVDSAALFLCRGDVEPKPLFDGTREEGAHAVLLPILSFLQFANSCTFRSFEEGEASRSLGRPQPRRGHCAADSVFKRLCLSEPRLTFDLGLVIVLFLAMHTGWRVQMLGPITAQSA